MKKIFLVIVAMVTLLGVAVSCNKTPDERAADYVERQNAALPTVLGAFTIDTMFLDGKDITTIVYVLPETMFIRPELKRENRTQAVVDSMKRTALSEAGVAAGDEEADILSMLGANGYKVKNFYTDFSDTLIIEFSSEDLVNTFSR